VGPLRLRPIELVSLTERLWQVDRRESCAWCRSRRPAEGDLQPEAVSAAVPGADCLHVRRVLASAV